MSKFRYRVERGAYGAPGGDHNDCAVRSLMVAACVDYAVAYDACARAGRKESQGMFPEAFYVAIREFAPAVQYARPRITLARFVVANARGHFVLFVRGHFLALCDGIVFDWDKGISSAGRQRGAKRIVRCSWCLV
jgi:hypothetical protein